MDGKSPQHPQTLPDEPKRTNVDPVIAAEMMLQQEDNIVTDVLGSYTGLGVDGDTPEQDADDL